MVKIYLGLLFLACVSWHVVWTQPTIRVRDDKDCAVASRRRNLPQCDWHYIAYFPRIFRSGVEENVAFSTYGFPYDVAVTVSIYDRSKKPTPENIIKSVTKNAKPGQLISIPVPVPHNAPGYLKVLINGVGKIPGDENEEWRFSNTSQAIKVERLGLSILIQTDRPIYKPGQLIQSRVIVVDSNLKPYNGTLDSVTISNPTDSIMRMWKDTQLVDGFASFELKTSVKPVEGEWKIKVATKKYKKELTISVKKYVLPKFQVTLEPPPYVTKMMNKATFEVCAKYSYGKPVLGKMKAAVCLEIRQNYWRRNKSPNKSPICLTFYKKIDGCVTLEVDAERLRNMIPRKKSPEVRRWYYSEPTVHVTFNATVKEKATGISMSSARISKTVLSKDVQLSIKSKSVFKPGFPLSIKILGKRPDDTPIKSLVVQLSAECTGSFRKTLLKDKEVTLTAGMLEMELPTIPFQAKNLNVKVKYMRKKLTLNERDWKRQSVASKTLKPWYSPSHSYLNVHKQKKPVEIGSSVSFTVGYTSVDPSPTERNITYSMMCGGNIVKADTFSRTFIPAQPYGTIPPTPPTTTTTTTTTDRKEESDGRPIPILQRMIYPPMWWESKATRPPMPLQFSTGTFTFSVNIDRKMLPSCKVVVYYVRREEVVADQTDFDVINEFKNQISMKFDRKEVKPGEPLKLTVKGAPSSRIAVAAVDKSIHFLAKGNDLKRKDILDIQNKLTISPGWVGGNEPRCGPRWYMERRDFVDSEKAFTNIGALMLSSLRIDLRPCEVDPMILEDNEEDFVEDELDGELGVTGAKRPIGGVAKKGGKGKSAKKTRVRSEFPETWLWTDERLSENGERVFDVKVPDSITTWYASGFGLSQAAGLGVANPTELRVFQPFFISMVLPYSVIRDEEVTIPAAVFSYMENTCISIKVSLEFSTEYKMIAGPNAKTCLCSGRTATVLFRIRPKKLGYIKIRIGAETLSTNQCARGKNNSDVYAADILVKKLLVEPEGIKEEYTRSTYFCPEKSKKFNTDLKLRVPDNLVPGSMFAKVTAMGDIMGSSLSNIDSLLAMPYGCGEQNMLKFAPNIFIMNYLNNTNQVTGEIKTKALDYMRTGYQRELTYKHKNGAYSAFGSRDKEGSTWLSAFVLKSYAQARPWIEVDEKEIEETSKWLMSLQSPDGCFSKVGKLHSKAMKGGVKTPATLSAYVLISLLEAGLLPDNDIIVNGMRCVRSAYSELKASPEKADSYSLSLMAYLFAKIDRRSYIDVMLLLDDKAIKEDGMEHWEEKKAKAPGPLPYYYKARSTDIEQTAYVLLARLNGEVSAVDSAVPVVRWLSKQRNSLGGWSSTQDTVLAMQALAEFAESTFTGDANMDVSVTADGFDHTFNINADNKLVLQQVEGVPVPSTLSIVGEGEGCALIQTNVKYNVERVKVEPTFKVSYKIKSIYENLGRRKSCRPQMIEVCASWLGEEESNMAIIDVQMVSGFEADEESFEKIRLSTKRLKEIEIKEKSVMFYFSRFDKQSQCVTFRVDQTTNVKNTKAAPIKVYDYYDTGKSATVMYEFTKEQCHGRKNTSMVF